MLAVARAAFGTAMTVTPIAVAFTISGTVPSISLGMLLGSVAKDVEAADAKANLVYFPMMFFWERSGPWRPCLTACRQSQGSCP
jgi:hypothetical protein